MGTSNISDVGTIFAQSQTAAAGVRTAEEDVKVAFTEVMGQMKGLLEENFGAGVQTGSTVKMASTAETKESAADYAGYSHREVEIREGTEQLRPKEDAVSKETEAFEEGVKDVLKEELGVTDGQIEEAMETLGLTFVDLLSPNQLAALVTELTGETDMGALLCNSEFQAVMQTVNELGENLLQKLGVTAEELGQMLADAPDTTAEEVPETVQEIPVENAGGYEEVSMQTVQTAQEQTTVQKEAAETMTANEVVVTEDTAEAAGEVTQADAEELQEPEEMPENLPKEEQQQTPENGQESGQPQSGNTHTETGSNVTAGMVQTETPVVQEMQNAPVFSEKLDVADIIRQITEFTRVTVANDATTMEMQLNPEHLGKIFLEVTSKNGIVSAHITAENEAVREALESQLVELRQNMNQAGVKVDAVEVTVGGHEFEKNLEQNARQEERQAEEREKAMKPTRQINLNDLDELSGLMTEEEALVAQMMADRGNTVDFTA